MNLCYPRSRRETSTYPFEERALPQCLLPVQSLLRVRVTATSKLLCYHLIVSRRDATHAWLMPNVTLSG